MVRRWTCNLHITVSMSPSKSSETLPEAIQQRHHKPSCIPKKDSYTTSPSKLSDVSLSPVAERVSINSDVLMMRALNKDEDENKEVPPLSEVAVMNKLKAAESKIHRCISVHLIITCSALWSKPKINIALMEADAMKSEKYFWADRQTVSSNMACSNHPMQPIIYAPTCSLGSRVARNFVNVWYIPRTIVSGTVAIIMHVMFGMCINKCTVRIYCQ